MASLWVAWTHHWQCQGGESGGLSLTHCFMKRYWIPLTKHWLGALLGKRHCESWEFGPAWKDIEPWRLISKGSPWKKNHQKIWKEIWQHGQLIHAVNTQCTALACPGVHEVEPAVSGNWSVSLTAAKCPFIPSQLVAWQSFGTSSWWHSVDKPSFPHSQALCKWGVCRVMSMARAIFVPLARNEGDQH